MLVSSLLRLDTRFWVLLNKLIFVILSKWPIPIRHSYRSHKKQDATCDGFANSHWSPQHAICNFDL